MEKRFSFNVNAELFENQWGDLAIRFPGDRVYETVGTEDSSTFLNDVRSYLSQHRQRRSWHEIPPHELVYKPDWHCIGRLGFIDGDDNRPAIELESSKEELGKRAIRYLGDAVEKRRRG